MLVAMTSFLAALAPAAALAAVFAFAPSSTLAQGHDAHGAHASPYAGLEDRAIKALSEEEIASLERGDGMGFALAAELNGVPGPRHVLELAVELALRPDQRARVEEVQARMLAEARELGMHVLALEAELDRRFAHGHATADEVLRLSIEAGEARGRLRAAHLNAHLEVAEILDPEQVERYAQLRGYAPGA